MDYKEKLEAYRLIHLDDDQAIKWLEDNRLRERPRGFLTIEEDESRKVAEYIWHKRNNPSLNLAIAKYGTHIPTLKRIYNNSSESFYWGGIPNYSTKIKKKENRFLRLAALTNVFVGPKEGLIFYKPAFLSLKDLISILQEYPKSKDLIEAYFNNPHIPRDSLSQIIKREEDFAFISDDLHIYIIYYISQNPIVEKPRDSSYIDGWAEYSHNKLFFDLWGLFSTVPVTESWASVLCEIVGNTHLPFVGEELTVELFNRWQIEDENGDEDEDEDENEDLNPTSYSFWLRFALAKLIFKEAHDEKREYISPNHEDKAIRLAYYNSCKPTDIFGYGISDEEFYFYPSFDSEELNENNLTETQKSVFNKCRDLFSRDKNNFIEELIKNENFWRRKNERELLRDLASNLSEDKYSTADTLNSWIIMEERMAKDHPEFFKDDVFFEPPREMAEDWKNDQILEKIKSLEEKYDDTTLKELLSGYEHRCRNPYL